MLAFKSPVLYYGITVTNKITVTNSITVTANITVTDNIIVYCAMISRSVNECSQTLVSDAS
ncbi:MAG: hypothetical protein IJ661_08470 [Lachnospiraceae bacterium]|nr:hypothetical protein [Lachnospiraceae bacterium]